MPEKPSYEYGVPYRYGDACTHMVILRVWVLTYLYIYYTERKGWTLSQLKLGCWLHFKGAPVKNLRKLRRKISTLLTQRTQGRKTIYQEYVYQLWTNYNGQRHQKRFFYL